MMGNTGPPNRTLEEFLRWLKQAPEGTRVDAGTIAGVLAEALDGEKESPDLSGPEWTWADLLWVVPAERRLGVKEACEALGKSRAWLYKQMAAPKPGEDQEKRRLARIPHRRLDGQVYFTAGELRAWLRDSETQTHGGRMESTPKETQLKVAEEAR